MAKLARKGKRSHPKRSPQLTRKEQRKLKQQQKKENKRLFFSKKANELKPVTDKNCIPTEELQLKNKPKAPKKQSISSSKSKSLPIEKLLSGKVQPGDNESVDSDFSDPEVDALLSSVSIGRKSESKVEEKVKTKQKTTTRPDAADMHRREMRRQEDLQNASKKRRLKQLIEENEEEQRAIARLEKKLKLNKCKDKNRSVRRMFNDGLDYALEICLDNEEEIAKKSTKKVNDNMQKSDAAWSDNEVDAFSDLSDENDVDAGVDDSEESHSTAGENSESEEKDRNSVQEQFKEDIYGRKRDKYGNIVHEEPDLEAKSMDVATEASTGTTTQKYIPPHQRALKATEGDAQTLHRLYRQCKGLLNRLSEANLHKIATGIEELYMKNSRYHMNETLSKLLNEALISATLANERMVQEHLVMIAYLHAQIGNEIGAHFLQLFIKRFDAYMQELSALQIEDKRLNNVILVLSYMYIFKIYEHRLMHELIERLSDNLCEKSIECMLLIFQSVGFKLRKDDPMQFKQMMQSVQRKIADSTLEMKENLRLKFMVDILNAVKNNNISKIPQFDPELAESLRKRLKAMLRHDKYVVTLNISMDDLLRADQVGKWWIVGSAWSGNIEDMSAAQPQQDSKSAAECHMQKHRYTEKLLAMAKKLKMNTDERRNIFCIIMSAEDYVDAFEKIMHLSLKDQRAIAYVIIHCCLHEKKSNPYYAHLALKFCHHNRSYQLAFQYASWDRIHEISSLSKQQIRNLAKFLQYLIMHGGLVISVLKVIDFLDLTQLSFLLMRDIIVGLLLAENVEEPQIYQVFERIGTNAKLAAFKNSIRLFMQHFLLKDNGVTLKLLDDQLDLLKKRISYVDNILAYVDL